VRFFKRDQAGFTLIDVLFVVALIGVLTAIALPALLRAKGNAQASAMFADLKLINSAQLSYAISCGNGFYARDLPTLGLKPPGVPVGFVNEELAAGISVVRTGYTITMDGTPVAGSPAGCSGAPMGDGAPAYRAGADSLRPVDARFFATNAEGIIYEDQVSIYAGMPEWGPSPVGRVIQ
jgi:type IV pilus assembly protein PilA